MADNVNRFLGGPPLAVLGKLILLSILIGVVLSALGLDPLNIFEAFSACSAMSGTWASMPCAGCGSYFLLGAVIVIPIWLIMRLVSAPRGR